ncbi:RHS repeat-associated core domain-containing protein [Akkermansia glycaniphila]|uniref:RHS repeat domain-containing protein n=1 Tax=Akkermansia glycaniphila TaxID=1679444 RepID=UPI001C038C54|nr:RHS repeat-associated core domain-containing protein [Akkermansia glycaniphila]MBT9450107.1 RHS repeat-associated core domain-containing protein [Akkermansia glycaniphila]
MKKVTVNEAVVLHQHYLYRGYLQIAALGLTRSNAPALWLLHWDPTQPVATRPLSLRKNGTWYTYGHDLTKNVTELYKADGTIATAYDYIPYGSVTASGIDQPIQWSSEHDDPELALVYYNYRHYNPLDGRWINRDPIAEEGGRDLYGFVRNNPYANTDYIGETPKKIECQIILVWGHGSDVNEAIVQQHSKYNPHTCAFGPLGCYADAAPDEYAIPDFPDVSQSLIGDSEACTNAGFNPPDDNEIKNEQVIRANRRQGFANLLRAAITSATKEAKKICERSTCRSVSILFIGIGERSGLEGTKVLGKRLQSTTEASKGWSNRKTWTIPCPKKKIKKC